MRLDDKNGINPVLVIEEGDCTVKITTPKNYYRNCIYITITDDEKLIIEGTKCVIVDEVS